MSTADTVSKLFDLTGMTALVTGGGDGIGRGCCEILAAAGANVVVANRTYAKAESVADAINAGGGHALPVGCDVTDTSACDAAVKAAIDSYGALNILVNNAGITKDGLMMRMSEEDFTSVIDVNLKGTFHGIRFASRQMMKQRSGKIINLASVVGICGNAGQVNYAASKAGVIGMTKSAAKELASRNITVNAIAPGFIETDMTEVLPEKIKEASAAQIPLGKFGKAEDVANAVAFLASEDAGYITGQVLHVDGGMVM